jgi:exosome complex component RRP42
VTGDGGAAEIIVNDDPFSNIPLPGASRLPLTVTLCKIGGANEWIIDATADEEQCSTMRLTLSLSPSGRMCGLSKGGVGTINLQALDAIMAHAAALGVQLNKLLTNEVKRGRGELDEDGEAATEVKRPVATGGAAAAADGKGKGKGSNAASKKKSKQAMTD